MKKSEIISRMIDFYEGSLHDIEHFLKVYAYASLIAAEEGLSREMTETVEIAAIVHDIACPLCREKYGNAAAYLQEKESEALLRPFLAEFMLPQDMTERIIYLVCHHHTYTGVDGIDYRILLEADYLVNASESGYSRENIQNFVTDHVCTSTGRKLFESMYLR